MIVLSYLICTADGQESHNCTHCVTLGRLSLSAGELPRFVSDADVLTCS